MKIIKYYISIFKDPKHKLISSDIKFVKFILIATTSLTFIMYLISMLCKFNYVWLNALSLCQLIVSIVIWFDCFRFFNKHEDEIIDIHKQDDINKENRKDGK